MDNCVIKIMKLYVRLNYFVPKPTFFDFHEQNGINQLYLCAMLSR